jgi:curved DNA-binding protein CbpA
VTKNLYDILEVSPTASQEMIRAAWTMLMKRHHPDMGGPNNERAYEINEAYQVLSDPAKRAAYDQQLAAQAEIESPPINRRPTQPWPTAQGDAAEWLRQQGRRVADQVIDEILAEHGNNPLLNAFAEMFRNPYQRRPQ